MRVIDGMHRLRAAQERKKTRILAKYVDCSEAEAFALAVHTNVTHGLLLSARDKEESAARIIEMHPDWSTRRIATVCSLSERKVETLRACPAAACPQLDKRVGSDGKTRFVDIEPLKQKAKDLLEADPKASLRDVARKTGISLKPSEESATPWPMRSQIIPTHHHREFHPTRSPACRNSEATRPSAPKKSAATSSSRSAN